MVINLETQKWTLYRVRDFGAFVPEWNVFIKNLPEASAFYTEEVGPC